MASVDASSKSPSSGSDEERQHSFVAMDPSIRVAFLAILLPVHDERWLRLQTGWALMLDDAVVKQRRVASFANLDKEVASGI